MVVHSTYFTITRFQDLIEYFDMLKQYGSKDSFEDYTFTIKQFFKFIFEPLKNFKFLILDFIFHYFFG